jgi:hypothetical protein
MCCGKPPLRKRFIARNVNSNMSTVAPFSDIAEPERTILQTLNVAESNVERRIDLADAIDEPYPPHEEALLQRGLIKEVGVYSTHEDGERVIYRRFTLTPDGERVLAWDEQQGDESTPKSVEPATRPAKPAPEHQRLSWTDLSESVDQFETRSVDYDEETEEIHVTLDHNGEEWTVTFTKREWFMTGCREFRDQYHGRFHEFPTLDEREFGILQTLWVEHFAVQGDSDDDPSQSQKERAKAYLAGEGVDDSVRAAAAALDVSVGTVQAARSELNAEN